MKKKLLDFELKQAASYVPGFIPGSKSEEDLKAERFSLLKQVMQHLRTHNDSEEQNDLPQLEPKLGPEGSEKAAADFKRTKKFAPTQ